MAWIVERRGGFLVRWRDAERKTRSKFVHTPEEAEELRAKVEAQARARRVLSGVEGIPGWESERVVGEAAEPEYAFETYLRAAIENDRNLRETTREMYLIGVRNHIEKTPLGKADIRGIQPEDVQRFWDGLEIGNGALRNVQQLLSKGFNRAVRGGLIDVSPLRRTDIRRPTKRQRAHVVPLTVAQIERLADAASTRRTRLAVLLMAYTGLRAGEVGGLRVQDVVAERGQLRLRQQVVRTHSKKFITDLKTEAARRTVPVPPSLIAELRAFYEEEPPAADGRIFGGPNGELWAHSAINAAVKKAAARAGLPGVHSHMLRHTAVSLLIDDGANPKAIQAFVGHSNIQMTLGVYGHLFDYGGAALAESMERRREAHRNGTTALA